MDRDITQFTPREGMTVYGSDGDKLGEIDAVEAEYFVVRKGFFFPEDHYIPRDAVATFDEENVYLAYTKDEVLSQEWTTEPDSGAVDIVEGDVGATGADSGTALEHDAEPFLHEQDTQETHVNAGDHISVAVHEEDLAARTRQVERGAVRVDKDVITEEQSIDVPVTEEHVEVTRRTVDRDVAASADAFEEGTIEVPVRGEEVDVEKRTRVVGEVDIDKTAEQRTARVTDTVRREEVTVDDEVVDAVDDVDTTRRR